MLLFKQTASSEQLTLQTNTLPHAELDLNRILLRMRSLCYKTNHLQLKSYATQSGETARQSRKLRCDSPIIEFAQLKGKRKIELVKSSR